jgi:hypothetical protein
VRVTLPLAPIVPARLAGTPAQIGRGHGEALRAQIHAFLDDGLCRLDHVLVPSPDRTRLRATIDSYGEVIARDLPDIYAEIEGIADGAGIDVRDALLIQIRREVQGFSRLTSAGDCSTICRQGPSGALLAQTIDLNGDLDDQMTVLRIEHAGSGRRAIVLSFSGLVGYLGFNSDGLAIGLNLLVGGQWGPGIPPYVAIRHLLDTCADVASCLERLRELTLASSRALMICDRREAAWVELVDGRMAVTRGDALAHTNHILAPELAGEDAINPFARMSSVKRLEACQAALSEFSAASDPETVMALFAQPPICKPDSGDMRRERTVGAVVMRPAAGELYVRRGDPALSQTQRFGLMAG